MGVAEKTAAPLPAKLAGLVREAKWLVLVALALYLLLVFSTFHRADPGWSHSATDAAVRNAGGLVGALVGRALPVPGGMGLSWPRWPPPGRPAAARDRLLRLHAAACLERGARG